MSTLTGQKIKDTYDGLLKTVNSTQGIPATGQVLIEDGLGNNSALNLGAQGNGATISGNFEADNILSKETDENVFVGENVGRNISVGGINNEGRTNTAIGTNSLETGTTVKNSTAIGTDALKSSKNGSFNVAVGDSAMQQNVNGNSNTAIGSGSLKNSTTASFNVAIGRDTLSNNINGNSNTAIGINALRDNIATSFNVAIGANTMANHIQGASNLAIGRDCLANQNTGTGNIALGQRALRNNDGVSNNIGIGTDAGRNISTGSQNIAIGRSSQSGGTGTGNSNTTLGFQAGQTLYGNNNLLLGSATNPSAQSVSNEITLGNGGISKLRCAVTSITSLSDERDKTDIKPLEYGLDFVNQLKPKEFVWNQRVEYGIDYDEEDNEIEVELPNRNRGKKDFGFIAQDVQKVDDDTLRLVSDDNPEKLELSYGKLVPILVKAIQELQAEVNALKK